MVRRLCERKKALVIKQECAGGIGDKVKALRTESERESV